MNRAARLVIFGLVSAWVIKAGYLVKLFVGNVGHDVAHPLFPAFFENGWVSLVAYLLPMLAAVSFCFPLTQARVISVASLFAACALTLLLHANGHNDATYCTVLWVSLWLLWLGTQWHAPVTQTTRIAIVLGHAIVGMIFLGGFVGKLTPEYWSGETLYHIFFVQRETVLFSAVRARFEAGDMEQLARGLARGAVVAEGVLACALLIPPRLLCWIGVPLLLGMMAVCSYLLYSVLGGLLFLILACHSLAKENSARPALVA